MNSAWDKPGVPPLRRSNGARANVPPRFAPHKCFSFPPGERVIEEVEIETAALRRARSLRHERFLKGPVLMRHIGAANKLSGQALALFLAIRHRMDLTGKPMVTLPRSLLDELGVSKDAKSRGLRLLEGAELIIVDRSKGRAASVGLVTSARGG